MQAAQTDAVAADAALKTSQADLLRAQADQELDPGKRKAMLDQLQDMLDQDPPWLFIGFTDHLLMWRANVRGLALDKRVQSEWVRVDIAWLDA